MSRGPILPPHSTPTVNANHAKTLTKPAATVLAKNRPKDKHRFSFFARVFSSPSSAPSSTPPAPSPSSPISPRADSPSKLATPTSSTIVNYNDPAFSNDPYAHPLYVGSQTNLPLPIQAESDVQPHDLNSGVSVHNRKHLSVPLPPPRTLDDFVLRQPPNTPITPGVSDADKPFPSPVETEAQSDEMPGLTSRLVKRNPHQQQEPARATAPELPGLSRAVSERQRGPLPPRPSTAPKVKTRDRIDELDRTSPYALHHGGPYEVARMVGRDATSIVPSPPPNSASQMIGKTQRPAAYVPLGAPLGLSPGQVIPHNYQPYFPPTGTSLQPIHHHRQAVAQPQREEAKAPVRNPEPVTNPTLWQPPAKARFEQVLPSIQPRPPQPTQQRKDDLGSHVRSPESSPPPVLWTPPVVVKAEQPSTQQRLPSSIQQQRDDGRSPVHSPEHSSAPALWKPPIEIKVEQLLPTQQSQPSIQQRREEVKLHVHIPEPSPLTVPKQPAVASQPERSSPPHPQQPPQPVTRDQISQHSSPSSTRLPQVPEEDEEDDDDDIMLAYDGIETEPELDPRPLIQDNSNSTPLDRRNTAPTRRVTPTNGMVHHSRSHTIDMPVPEPQSHGSVQPRQAIPLDETSDTTHESMTSQRSAHAPRQPTHAQPRPPNHFAPPPMQSNAAPSFTSHAPSYNQNHNPMHFRHRPRNLVMPSPLQPTQPPSSAPRPTFQTPQLATHHYPQSSPAPRQTPAQKPVKQSSFSAPPPDPAHKIKAKRNSLYAALPPLHSERALTPTELDALTGRLGHVDFVKPVETEKTKKLPKRVLSKKRRV